MTKLQKVIQKLYEDNKKEEFEYPIGTLLSYLYINSLITREEYEYLDKLHMKEVLNVVNLTLEK